MVNWHHMNNNICHVFRTYKHLQRTTSANLRSPFPLMPRVHNINLIFTNAISSTDTRVNLHSHKYIVHTVIVTHLTLITRDSFLCFFNALKTQRNLFYLKAKSVPHSKHTASLSIAYTVYFSN